MLREAGVVLWVGDIVLGREVRQEELRGRGARWDQLVEFVGFLTVSAVTVNESYSDRFKSSSYLGLSICTNLEI